MMARLSSLWRKTPQKVKAINPVDYSLKNLSSFIDRNESLKGSDQVLSAFQTFEAALRAPSPIGQYIKDSFSSDNENPGLTNDEISVFGAALCFAVGPATTRISRLVADLNEADLRIAANLITQNLGEEAGDSQHLSHMDLLYKSLNIVGHNSENHILDARVFGPQSFPMALKLINPHSLSQSTAIPFSGLGYNPEYSLTYTVNPLMESLPDSIGEYGAALIQPAQTVSQGASLVSGTLQHLVQETDAARSSHIWAWHHMLENYLEHIPENFRREALKWSKIHIDENIGVEIRHVEEALEVSCYVMKGLAPQDIATGFKNAAEIMEKRTQLWHDTVEGMTEIRIACLEQGNNPIPPAPQTLGFLASFMSAPSTPPPDPAPDSPGF